MLLGLAECVSELLSTAFPSSLLDTTPPAQTNTQPAAPLLDHLEPNRWWRERGRKRVSQVIVGSGAD